MPVLLAPLSQTSLIALVYRLLARACGNMPDHDWLNRMNDDRAMRRRAEGKAKRDRQGGRGHVSRTAARLRWNLQPRGPADLKFKIRARNKIGNVSAHIVTKHTCGLHTHCSAQTYPNMKKQGTPALMSPRETKKLQMKRSRG